jgi:YVTN family beta-propeller protein
MTITAVTENRHLGEGVHYFLLMMAIAAVGVTTLAFTSASVGQPTAEKSLQLETKIPLGNVAGRIDHMAIDPERHRLFVAELGNDSVGVVDLNARKVVHRISDLKEPQGVAYIRMNDSLYVANGGDGSVRVFHGPDYSPVGRIDLGADADNIRADLLANACLLALAVAPSPWSICEITRRPRRLL